MAVGEQARRRLIRRPAPGDHIARDCPRCAAEADQRHIARERGLQAVKSFQDGREPAPVGFAAELRQAVSVADRVEARAVAGFEGDASVRARRAARECRRTGSPRRSRTGGSAAASPRRRGWGHSKNRERSRLSPEDRDIPADSAPPGASARSAGVACRSPARAASRGLRVLIRPRCAPPPSPPGGRRAAPSLPHSPSRDGRPSTTFAGEGWGEGLPGKPAAYSAARFISG